MSQLPDEFECPVDDVIIRICSKIAPFFYATGHNANMLTFYGALASGYGLQKLRYNNLYSFAAFYALGYAFDCLDGHFARRYKMTSKFGEYAEHIKDIVTTALLFLVFFKSYKVTSNIILLFLVTGLGLNVHMGYQQKYLKSKGGFLDFLQKFSPGSYTNMKWTRWLGCGTFMLASVTAPFFMEFTGFNKLG